MFEEYRPSEKLVSLSKSFFGRPIAKLMASSRSASALGILTLAGVHMLFCTN